jgi:hypothetical protein
MQKQRVSMLLEQLHQELADADTMDDATAAKLREAIAEIEATLEHITPTTSQPLVQRVRDAVYHLPESHPAIKNTVGRIADALAQMGI